MVKKEGAIRGYMIPEEILAHLNGLPSSEIKADYLEKILKKQKLLSEKTRKAVYHLQGDFFVDIAKKYERKAEEWGKGKDSRSYHEDREEHNQIIAKQLQNLARASIRYEEAGDFAKAAELVTPDYRDVDVSGDDAAHAAIQSNKFAEYHANIRKAQLYEKAGDSERAKTFRRLAAGEALKAGDSERALFDYLSVGDTSEADGLFEKMYAAYNKTGDSKAASGLLRKFVSQKKKLTSLTSSLTAIIGIIGGLFLLIPEFLTSPVQLSPGTSSVDWKLGLGIFLLLIGIAAGYFWIIRKTK